MPRVSHKGFSYDSVEAGILQQNRKARGGLGGGLVAGLVGAIRHKSSIWLAPKNALKHFKIKCKL